MQFLYPQILWALLALTIPVIIHLFHFRKFKKVYFTNVRLLREIKEEKSTRNKIRNLLVLLSRLLALAFLILAFAQPFIAREGEVKKGINYVSVFIDNSNSMMASSEDVPMIDKAKRKAEEIIQAYADTDQFQVLTHEMTGTQQRWLNKENTILAIEDTRVTPEVNKLSFVYERQKESLPEEGNFIFYYISDFQKTITDEGFAQDSVAEINLIPLQSVRENNLAIDSVWFESVVPSINQNNQLLVRIRNFGSEDRNNVRLSLIQNGQSRPEGTFDIDAYGSVTDTIHLLFTNTGWQRLQLKIDDYPIQFDDSYYIAFDIKEKINVLSITADQPNIYLNALFRSLAQFDLQSSLANNIQYDRLGEKDLIIISHLNQISTGLSGSLKEFAEKGGNVIVFPPAGADLDSYNNFLTQMGANSIASWSDETRKVYRINTSEFVFSDVFDQTRSNLKLPVTRGNYIFNSYSGRGGEYLLEYRDGNDYISKYELDRGNIFVSAAPLSIDYNDLVNNAEIFVPLIYKTAFASNSRDRISFTIGVNNFTELKTRSQSNEIVYRISGPEEFIPGQNNIGGGIILDFNNMISTAGHYDVTLDEEIIKVLAFNYDRKESDLQYLSPGELEDRYGRNVNVIDNVLQADLTGIIKEKDKGIILWRWCLILALIFLAVETLLLRFWKV